MRCKDVSVVSKQRRERNDLRGAEGFELINAVHHRLAAAGIPNCHHKGCIRIKLHGCFRRLYPNAVYCTAPERRIVIAEQDRVDRTSHAASQIAGAKTNDWRGKSHLLVITKYTGYALGLTLSGTA